MTAPAVERALDKEWARLQALPPVLGSREIVGFALEAAGRGVRPEQVEAALVLLEKMQDRVAESKTYGNFRWYWRETQPEDLNAVEFVTQQAVLLHKRCAEQLSSTARARLSDLLRLSVEGIHRHKVPVGYTNIFLMKTWNLLALGEALSVPELTEEGRTMLDQWLDFTARNGIREFLSPTYYGVDLDSLALMASELHDPGVHEKATRGLRLFWADIGANWFAPAGRLGGAHGRDYDYLTGHGELDRHLFDAGWIEAAQWKPPPFEVFAEATRWLPPAGLRLQADTALPRFVFQKWDVGADAWAAQYVGRHVSIGVSGQGQGAEDKIFAVNLAGPAGCKTAAISFFMDGRDDPYGQKKQPTGPGGHSKAHHLAPFFRAVQRGPEVLFVADHPREAHGDNQPLACLLSHLVLPVEAQVWLGDTPADPQRRGQPLPPGSACVLRLGDAAVGFRFLRALDGSDKPAAIELINDGEASGVRRLTVTHAAGPPEGTGGMVAVWARVAEGLDDDGFTRFRKSFALAEADARTVDGGGVAVWASGLEGRLGLTCYPGGGHATRIEGSDSQLDRPPMSVDGRDFSTPILLQGATASFEAVAHDR